MATTYEKIATATLGAAATVTFSSIPATYTDLRVVIAMAGNYGNPFIRFNNDSTALYSYTYLKGDGTSATSVSSTSNTSIILTSASLSTLGFPIYCSADIFSYAGSTFKTVLSDCSFDKNGTGNVERYVNLYRSTTAISRIDVNIGSGGAYTGQVTLYGILKA
jgi:hypothetical protein